MFLIPLYHHKVAVAIINTGSAALGNIYVSSRMLSTCTTVYQSENTRVYLRSKSFICFFNQSRKVSHTLPKTIALFMRLLELFVSRMTSHLDTAQLCFSSQRDCFSLAVNTHISFLLLANAEQMSEHTAPVRLNFLLNPFKVQHNIS